MTRSTLYPLADSRAQWFAGTWPGSIMALSAPVLVLHSTESGGWPSYSGGAVAPTLTLWPQGPGRAFWRQHFPVNMSARALMNLPGGVQTNTAGAIQLEMVGTCDPATHAANPGWIYWPQAPDWALQPVADFAAWLKSEWGLPLVGPPRPFLPYPASYGASTARMTFAEWVAFSGVCAHQDVPENDHGDAGAFPLARMFALASPAPAPTPAPPPPAAQIYVPQEDDMKPWLLEVDGAAWQLVDGAGRVLTIASKTDGDSIKAYLDGAKVGLGTLVPITSVQRARAVEILREFWALTPLPGAPVA